MTARVKKNSCWNHFKCPSQRFYWCNDPWQILRALSKRVVDPRNKMFHSCPSWVLASNGPTGPTHLQIHIFHDGLTTKKGDLGHFQQLQPGVWGPSKVFGPRNPEESTNPGRFQYGPRGFYMIVIKEWGKAQWSLPMEHHLFLVKRTSVHRIITILCNYIVK